MAQVIIDYDQYQEFLSQDRVISKLKKQNQQLEDLVWALNKELNTAKAELFDLKATKNGY